MDQDQTADLGPQCLPLCLSEIEIFRYSYFAGVLTSADPEGGGGDRGSGPSLENQKLYGFL